MWRPRTRAAGSLDGPFNLVVDCGLPGWSYAVVGYNANLVRSTPGVTLTSLGAGRYDVTFPASISRCAYLATVGDPGNGLVSNPGGVYTGSGTNPSTVYVETKNPGGGLSAGIPFHLAVICPAAADVKVAVVAANGSISRGSRHTRSFSLAPGQYTLITNRPLSACAAVATRGSTGTAVPFDPATAEIVPGAARNTRRHPGPPAAVLRREPGQRILPRRRGLLNLATSRVHRPVPQTRGRGSGCAGPRRDRPDAPNRAICPLMYSHAKPATLRTESAIRTLTLWNASRAAL